MKKDFEEFISSIDPDTYNTIMISVRQAMNSSNRCGNDDQAFLVALELLERYHNWINEKNI